MSDAAKEDDGTNSTDLETGRNAESTLSLKEIGIVSSDKQIPEDRRMFYGLMGIGGMRFGEAAAIRWSDYLVNTEPMGKFIIASFCPRRGNPVRAQIPRDVPVHPVFAKMLTRWRLHGFEQFVGHPPLPEDLIVPSREGNFRNVNQGLHKFHADLARIGLRHRRLHDLRRTFIKLTKDGGARLDILKWIAYGAPRDHIDVGKLPTWATQCGAVAALDLGHL